MHETDNSANAKPKLGKRRTDNSADAEPTTRQRRTETRQAQNRQLDKRKTDNSANAEPKRKGSSLKKMLPTNALPKIVANPTHEAERAA